MLWLVLSIVLGIVGIGGLIYGGAAPVGQKKGGYLTAAGCAAVWLVLTFFLSLHTVGQREVGLVQSFSGTIGSHTKSPGVVFTAPWNHIRTENVGIQKEVFDFGTENSAVSKDQQPITAVLVVNYQVEPQDAVALWKNVGPQWKSTLLDGRVPQDFKETTAQFTSPQITLNRPALRRITLKRLRRELCPPGGEFCIHVTDVFVQNVGYSKAYTAAIEAKQVQVQAALRAQAKVAQAKAEAEQAVATAKGEAEAIELKGRALRNNPEVLRLTAIQKLAPNAQVIFCSSGDCPNIVGGFVNGATAASSGR